MRELTGGQGDPAPARGVASAPRAPARGVRSADRRRQLLAAAERVVMRQGPDASMNAIAAEAGVTKPIIYRHFGDKGGLYRALAERQIDGLLAQLQAALRTPGTQRQRTAATIDAYLAAIEAQPQVYRFLMHHAVGAEPGVRHQVGLFIARMADELAAGMVALGHFRADERAAALTWGHALVGMVQAAGDWWLQARATSRAELVEHLVALLYGAWGAADRTAPPRADSA